MEGLIGRVLVATDGSTTAGEAVRWAATLAKLNDADLVLVRVLPPAEMPNADTLTAALAQLAAHYAGPKGTARLLVDNDPALPGATARPPAQRRLTRR